MNDTIDRTRKVFEAVEQLYDAAPTSMGRWMWEHHVRWVAAKARELASKYTADQEIVYCAGLLHDLGDSVYERGHEDFETWSWVTAKDILKDAGYRKAERDAILEATRTHSCHPGQLPTEIEGEVLATADALWHIETSFFPEICYMNRPADIESYEEWQRWFVQKIERDFTVKIFFDDEREEVRADYESLCRVFKKPAFFKVSA